MTPWRAEIICAPHIFSKNFIKVNTNGKKCAILVIMDKNAIVTKEDIKAFFI